MYNPLIVVVNELSTTIDLESTLIRAEALFRRFQRTVEAIDKKSNFPKPKLRQRPITNASVGSVQSLRSNSSEAVASTSGTDTVSAGKTNSNSSPQAGNSSVKASDDDDNGKGKGAGTINASKSPAKKDGEELAEQRPKVISPELRELLSRKVEILPRKIVRREGEGLGTLKREK